MLTSMEIEDEVDSLNASFVSALSGPFISKDIPGVAESQDPLSESQNSMSPRCRSTHNALVPVVVVRLLLR